MNRLKLAEAFRILGSPMPANSPALAIGLYSSFEPLHLETLIAANIRVRSNRPVNVQRGTYGDLAGSLMRATERPADTAAIFVEWQDFDPRLGFRSSARWDGSVTGDILSEARQNSHRLLDAIARLSERCVVALSGPTLPRPMLDHTTPVQYGSLALELDEIAATFLREASVLPNVRILHRQEIDLQSPLSARLYLRLELHAGCPYPCAHAECLADMAAGLLYPAPRKKGLITDLDGVLWRGILGEEGPSGIAWTQERNAQSHALYQRELAVLANQGALLAVASKNDASIVRDALARDDLAIRGDAFFPVEANWGRKSQSVARILQAWNIAPDSVVFIDDSPMELGEVQEAFPEMLCLPFSSEPKAVWELLAKLRDLFGKPAVFEEDRIRAASLRASVVRSIPTAQDPETFARSLNGTIQFEIHASAHDKRAFELLSKTNQFNLNGRRYSESEWAQFFAAPGALGVSVSYRDRFGPLGKIATLLVHANEPKHLRVEAWVMSCRAFSRNIEHHTLDWLLRHFEARSIWFDYRETARNRPLRTFFERLRLDLRESGMRIDAGAIHMPEALLPHRISVEPDRHVQMA